MENGAVPRIEEQPFSPWLESALREVYETPPDAIAILTRNKQTGKISGYYYNIHQEDGAVFSQKLLLDTVRHMLLESPEFLHMILDDRDKDPEAE